jgi:hypothetical protein
MSLLTVEVGGLDCRHATRCPSCALYTSQRVAARLVHKNELEGLVFRQLIQACIAQFWISFARDSLILLLRPIIGFQRSPNASYGNYKLLLIPYEVHHLVEIQVWHSEEVIQECGQDVRGYARAPAADVVRYVHVPEDSVIGAGASYGACATVDDISDIFFG